jgi:hypothetical protein
MMNLDQKAFFLILLLASLLLAERGAAQMEIKIFGAYQATDDKPFSFSERTHQEYSDRLTGQETSFIRPCSRAT